MLEDVLGCKWTFSVLGQVRNGVRRPGALVRSLEGLTTKVLNERLAKLVRFGILTKKSYPEVPPRVEYHLSDFGVRFAGLLDEVRRLEDEFPPSPLASARGGRTQIAKNSVSRAR